MKNMKQYSLILSLVVVTVFSGCKKEEDPTPTPDPTPIVDPLEPDTTQHALLLEATGISCGYCPAYGTVMAKQMSHEYPAAIVIALHGDYAGPDKFSEVYPINATFISNFMPNAGAPNFNVGSTDAGQEPEQYIVDALAQTATAGVKHTVENDGTKYTVKVRSKFFTASSGTYYLGSYALQEKVAAQKSKQLSQSDYVNILTTITSEDTTKWKSDQGSDGNGGYYFKKDTRYYHDHVLTTQPDDITSVWGQKLDSTSFSANNQVDYTFTITPSSTWYNLNDVKIVSILWKKNGSKYEFVNGYREE